MTDIVDELRERLGRRVREVWIAWAIHQPSPKPSWLLPYDELPEPDKEADRCIGSVIYGDCIAEHSDAISLHALNQRSRHRFRPFTMRDNSIECSACGCSEHNPCHWSLDAAFVSDVEDEIGMDRGAWGMVDPQRLCSAVLDVSERRRA